MTVINLSLLRHLIERIRFYVTRPSWLSEVASGLGTTIWGVLALNTDDRSTWPSLELFVQLNGNSPVWEIMAVVFGIGQLGLFKQIDQGWNVPWLRLIAAGMIAWIWGVITIGAYPAPGIGAFVMAWFINAYLVVRIFALERK